MAKLIPDANIDLMLDIVEGDEVHVCAGQPTTFAEATTTFNLATQAISGANYTKANGDTNGRKNTLAPPAGTSITATGTADHVAVTTTTGSVLELVTTVTSQSLTSGGTVDIGSFDHEIGDAA
jgi:hypothetical protein